MEKGIRNFAVLKVIKCEKRYDKYHWGLLSLGVILEL